MSTFQGLPAALFEFFTELAQDNSKDFRAAVEPLKAWLDEHVSQHNH